MVTDDEAVSLIGSGSAQQASDKLLKTALEKISKDNVSVIVVTL